MNETKTIPIPLQEESHSPVDSESGSPPQLSAHALAALQEFYAEEAAWKMHPKPGQGDAPKLIAEDWVKNNSVIQRSVIIINNYNSI